MNTNINNNNDQIEETAEPCMFVEFSDRDFDDTGYCNPEELSGEMAILKEALPPADLRPVAVSNIADRKQFSFDNPQTWLLSSQNHDSYFKGLRTCIKDDDQLAFPSVRIKGDTITLPSGKLIKPSISGTMPTIPASSGKSNTVANLSFAAAAVATAAGISAVQKTPRKLVVNDRTHSAKPDSDQPKAVAEKVVAGQVITDPEIIQSILGVCTAINSDGDAQFKRLFPHGRICPACNKPFKAITANCQGCGRPAGFEFRGIKHIVIGNQNADWLEADLGSTRMKFVMMYIVLFAGTFYLGHKDYISETELIGPFMLGFMLLYFWRMFALFLRRRSTIKARREQYLQSTPNVHPEVKNSLTKNSYNFRMTPLEIELVQGYNVFSDIKNENLIFFIGDRRY